MHLISNKKLSSCLPIWRPSSSSLLGKVATLASTVLIVAGIAYATSPRFRNYIWSLLLTTPPASTGNGKGASAPNTPQSSKTLTIASTAAAANPSSAQKTQPQPPTVAHPLAPAHIPPAATPVALPTPQAAIPVSQIATTPSTTIAAPLQTKPQPPATASSQMAQGPATNTLPANVAAAPLALQTPQGALPLPLIAIAVTQVPSALATLSATPINLQLELRKFCDANPRPAGDILTNPLDMIKPEYLNWATVDCTPMQDPNWASDFENFQEKLVGDTVIILKHFGFLVNKHGIPKGIEATSPKDIAAKKAAAQAMIKANEKELTQRFLVLSSMGMNGYAERIRTFLAGLDITAEDVLGSVALDKYPGGGGGDEVHEDVWTAAQKEGQKQYLSYVNIRNDAAQAAGHAYFSKTPFDQWTKEQCKELCENAQLTASIYNMAKAAWDKAKTQPAIALMTEALTKIAFLKPWEGHKIMQSLPLDQDHAALAKAFDVGFHKRLEVLGQKDSFFAEKERAKEMSKDLHKLHETFGKNKIYPRSIELAIASYPGKTIQAAIQELQDQNIIGKNPDQDGFYPLLNASSYVAASSDSYEGRIKTVLDIAEGNITSRYTARRLAPTFYQGTTSNENFEIPRHNLPLLLQHEELRFQVAEKTKESFLAYLGMQWDPTTGTFSIQDAAKLARICDQQVVELLPFGPSIVSVFLDSLGSLGEKIWADLLLQTLIANAPGVNTIFWKNAIDNQNTIFERAQNPMQAAAAATAPAPNDPISPVQMRDYRSRVKNILQLNKDGELLVRVPGNMQGELIDEKHGIYAGKWNLAGGPNLSTTLIPKRGSLLEMQLWLGGNRGVIGAHKAVHSKYLGNSFVYNGCTQYNNFETHLKKRPDGQPFDAVRDQLAKEGAEVEVGQRDPHRSHTEIAFFRPAERSLVQALFFKVNDEGFGASLKELILLQNTIRQQYGFFLPIFAYKDHQFQEVIVDEMILGALELQGQGIATRQLSHKEKTDKATHRDHYFNLYGDMDTQMVIDAKNDLKSMPQPKADEVAHGTNFRKLFDLQLMLLQLKNPSDKVSFSMKGLAKIEDFINQYLTDYPYDKDALLQDLQALQNKSAQNILTTICAKNTAYTQANITHRRTTYRRALDVERPVDLSVMDNLHLVFPTIAPTGNTSAEAQDLFFSHSLFIRFLRDKPSCKKYWSAMAKRNMKVFLGLELTVDARGAVTGLQFHKQFLSYFKDSQDATGMQNYAKCISRLVQMLKLLENDTWAQAIITELRKKNQLGENFGKDAGTDYFSNSPEILAITQYLEKLKNPQFQEVKPLPQAHGNQGAGDFAPPLQMTRGGRASAASAPVPVAATAAPAAYVGRRRGGMPGAPYAAAAAVDKFPTGFDAASAAAALQALSTIGAAKATPAARAERDKLAQTKGLTNAAGEYNSAVVFDLMGANFADLQKENAFANKERNMETVRVFHRPMDSKKVKDLLVNTVVRTTNGDLDILCPDGTLQAPPSGSPHFLNDAERQEKRSSMVTAGLVTITAKGGFKSQRETLDKPIDAIVINTAAPQFEKYGMASGELEATVFVCKENPGLKALWEGVHEKQELACARGKKTLPLDALQAAGKPLILHEDDPHSLEADIVRLRCGDYFLQKDFQESMFKYFDELVLRAINEMANPADTSKNIYLKATALGAGFFAALGLKENFKTSMRKYVIDMLVKSYEKLLKDEKFARGSVIEFPFYGLDCVPEGLKAAAQKAGVHIVWQEKRDLLDFSPVTTVEGHPIDPEDFDRVLLNAGDAFSFVGNEGESASVEAMLGNNSDLRQVFNWHSNPRLLDEKHYVALTT